MHCIFIPVKFILIFCTVLITSCKTQEFTPLNYNEEMIVFGKGGGFTGQVKEYCLLSNGQFFKDSNRGEDILSLENVDKQRVDQIFKSYQLLQLSEETINSPGNSYSYIIFKKNNVEHKILWGSKDDIAADKIKIYFSNLMQLARKQNDLTKETVVPTMNK